MSAEYEGRDPIEIAKQAERDLNSPQAKGTATSKTASDSVNESGIDDSVTAKFPGSEVTYGSAASGSGDNREIPESEGGGLDPETGRPLKARDFEGVGGPEDKARIETELRGGDDNVKANTK